MKAGACILIAPRSGNGAQIVEHGFGQQLLELAVFLLERPQPLRLRYVQAAILGPSSCTTSLPRSRACAPARLPSPPASCSRTTAMASGRYVCAGCGTETKRIVADEAQWDF